MMNKKAIPPDQTDNSSGHTSSAAETYSAAETCSSVKIDRSGEKKKRLHHDIAYFDMFSGISGDMTLGACVDLGVPVTWLNEQFEKMPLPGVSIRVEDVWHNGIKAANLFVEEISVPDYCSMARNYEQIKALISASPFSKYVISFSLSAFKKIALAESAIHGVPLENVHFHEVGGIDAIVDIVGAFLCMEYLGIKEVYASRIPLGSGSVTCSHGTLPVPAPATLKILKGVSVTSSSTSSSISSTSSTSSASRASSVSSASSTSSVSSASSTNSTNSTNSASSASSASSIKNVMELVTPTGAAIITTLTAHFGDLPDMVIGESGYGSGKRKKSNGLPNLLRIITGKRELGTIGKREEENVVFSLKQSAMLSKSSMILEKIYVVNTTIDDMNPEFYGYIMEKLFESGALDVSYTPLQMKKNRPGTRLEAICHEQNLNRVIKVILTESTTSGVRFHAVERAVLGRKNIDVKTSFGPVEAKEIIDPEGQVRIVPEYEACRRIALETGLPLQDVYKRICCSE